MLPLIAASVALAALSSAVPAPASLAGFTIAQVETGKKFLSGPLAMKATFLKYGKAVPAHIEAAAQAAQAAGTVSANPTQYDSEYLCPVTIGSNGQKLNLDFDTGSSDLWVFSSQLPSSQRSGHDIYTPGSSTSAKLQSGETWDISYQDGSGASGNIYVDKVVIGGVTATSQAVECATSVSSSFVSDTNDGLVGLAFDSINTASPNKVATFMNNVGPTLPLNLFAATLKKGAAGFYDFGQIVTSRYTGSITYTAVNTADGFWEFPVNGYSVGSKAYTVKYPHCIADTGTTLLYLPNAVVNNYWGTVSGAQTSQAAGGVIFPCSATLPNLSIKISGVSHTIPGSYLNYAPYTSNYCFGGLQSSAGIGFNILGDIFLKSQYVVFDTGNTRIGFAAQAGVST